MKMNSKIFLGLLCSIGISASASAACPTSDSDTRITDLAGLLTDKTVCVGSSGNWDAQEYHESGTKLIDYKHGPQVSKTGQTGVGPWNDWTDQVGNWSLTNDGTSTAVVNYDYNRDGTTDFSFEVYQEAGGANYYFCNATTTVPINSIKSSLVSCN